MTTDQLIPFQIENLPIYPQVKFRSATGHYKLIQLFGICHLEWKSLKFNLILQNNLTIICAKYQREMLTFIEVLKKIFELQSNWI